MATGDSIQIQPLSTKSKRVTGSKRTIEQSQQLWGWLFLLPWIVGFIAFTAIPIIVSFGLTFTDYTLANPDAAQFIGLANWQKLFNDPLTLKSLSVTIKFAFMAVPFGIVLPLAMAALLNSKHLMGKRIWRTLFYMPYMVPAVSGIFIWLSFFNGQSGWLNRMLRVVWIPTPPGWLFDRRVEVIISLVFLLLFVWAVRKLWNIVFIIPIAAILFFAASFVAGLLPNVVFQWAVFGVLLIAALWLLKRLWNIPLIVKQVIVAIWAGLVVVGVIAKLIQGGWLGNYVNSIWINEPPNWFQDERFILYAFLIMGVWGAGNAMLTMLATMQGVPTELYEAADVDGAGAATKFWNITLPMISPVIFYNLVLSVIGLMQYFTVPYIATQGTGRPNNAAYFFNMHLYKTAFAFFDMGYGATLAWFMFIIALVLTIFMFTTANRWVYYASGD
jgi:ABC-type sugar transport system permease subunit